MVVQQPQVQPQVPPQTAVPTAQASQIVGPGVQVRAPRRGSGGASQCPSPLCQRVPGWIGPVPGVLGAAPLGLSGFELHLACATSTLQCPQIFPLAPFSQRVMGGGHRALFLPQL